MLSLAVGHDVGYLTGPVSGGREGYYTGAVAAGAGSVSFAPLGAPGTPGAPSGRLLCVVVHVAFAFQRG